ncbi:unnamed protein product (macronuclear) [Paramecium tetraurelia]|uniref:Uncharacterized protein n=1 Tax=Paramecium tetraurelia TaxID=5888 RepID=A0DQU9_PARTE|nr:uncharacterized protein GSPATT00002816001 [Paramecium tetraurelia]CAK85416.1 unnamed protein product [Paramecium tetraurelia]|eukprot:XP_001452813.1 hypothetical protein (macronuclear) [Paramecium tetraurelia strain d4-2]
MANYREQPLSKSDYHNRANANNYQKTNKPVYNDEPRDLENYVQIPKRKQAYLENEVQDTNNRYCYKGNSKNEDPFSNNPYYNRAALDQVCSRSIITYLDQPNKLQDNCQNNEQQRDNQNQNQQKQNEPISQYYNNEQRDRYQEVKNYYYNQNHQFKSILSPKLYSRDQFDQQEQQQLGQNKQSQNQIQKYQKANQSLYENPSFGLIQEQQQIYQQSQNQPKQQQFPYSQHFTQEPVSQNPQKYVSNSTRQQYNDPNESHSQREFQQSKQCASYQSQSTQRLHQDYPVQKQQQYQQRLQYLDELKSRLPNDDIFQQQVDIRIPQTEQYYRQNQNERSSKINPIAAVSRMQRPNEINQDKYQYGQDQNYNLQNNRNYQHQKGQDYYDTQSYHKNNQKDFRENSHNQLQQRKNQQQQKTRTPNRYREDSYEREKQWFMQQTSNLHQNSQAINKRR